MTLRDVHQCQNDLRDQGWRFVDSTMEFESGTMAVKGVDAGGVEREALVSLDNAGRYSIIRYRQEKP